MRKSTAYRRPAARLPMTLSPHFFPLRAFRCLMAVACVTVLAACAGVETSSPVTSEDVNWTSASPANPDSSTLSAPHTITWQHCAFPGKKSTRYRAVRLDGRDAVLGESDSAASMLRQH